MRWYIASFALVLFLVGVQSAQACSCVPPPPPPAEALAASDAVFLGEVIKTRRDGRGVNEGNLFATFRVRQILKGDLQEERNWRSLTWQMKKTRRVVAVAASQTLLPCKAYFSSFYGWVFGDADAVEHFWVAGRILLVEIRK